MMLMSVEGIEKTFRVPVRKAGLKNAVSSFFHREYQVIPAVNDLSFTIGQGEMVGVIGPNGAGKSTTIKILSGILIPDKGRCVINGMVPWEDRKKYVKDIGVVFGQKSQLWWDLPAEDSFQLLKKIYKVPDETYKIQLNKLIEILELTELLEKPVRTMSLGQRMRCEIAAALIHSPKILFLDEPTLGLDAVSKFRVRQMLKDLNEVDKLTLLITTHDMDDIDSICNRVIMINEGKIEFDGMLSELVEKVAYNKTLRIEYTNTPQILQKRKIKLVKVEGNTAIYEYSPKELGMKSLLEILCDENVKDFSVGGEEIEKTIARIYQQKNRIIK